MRVHAKPKVISSLVVAIVFIVLAVALNISAANEHFKFEAEAGTLSGSAAVFNSASASAGAAVDFSPVSATDGTQQLVSRGVPLFTATNSGSLESLRDTNITQGWDSSSLPSWAAFDLSSLTSQQKQQLLISAYAPRSQDYVVTSGNTSAQTPLSYVVEVNSAAGGGNVPTANWTTVTSVTNNQFNTMQHLITMTGQNWLRFRIVSAIAGAGSVNLNVDIFTYSGSRPNDSWLFMGDSITAGAASYWTSDLQSRVAALAGGRWPAYISDGIGGTNTNTAMGIISGRLSNFTGKYVVLGYGTNDGSGSGFQMEQLVQAVIAAGKVPVVPRMPWSDTKLSNNTINQQIDALYIKYPEMLRGPDFWQIFLNRYDLISSGDVHPNSAGSALWRQSWAEVMAAQPN